MKTIVSINGTNFGSTGNIARQIGELAMTEGIKYYNAFPWAAGSKALLEHDIVIGNKWGKIVSVALGRITGYAGCFSFIATRNFLRKLDKIKPDIIHIHNLHDGFINLSMLFKYIKKNDIKVIWTMHDCWSFTGRCAYFTMADCDRWKKGCHDCIQKNCYPTRYSDRTKKMWKLKKKWFTGVKDLTVITPSKWLKELVKQSYMGEYPVKVINNGIDLDKFKPSESDFRVKNNIDDKFVILGVALSWEERKGLNDILELIKKLDDSYAYVLVGTDDEVDKILPEGVISIHRTHDQAELAEVYSAADVYINPTKEDNYPTVNMEAIACGTPVITYATGGRAEIPDETCGIAVKTDDVQGLADAVKSIKEGNSMCDACLKKSVNFGMNDRFREYIELYR